MTSTVLSVTGATPSPTYSTTTWWSSLDAEVWAYFPTGGSAFFNEQRRIVANTVPSGGAYTITVDVPFANSGYTNYVIRGQTSFQGVTTLADVWRKFYIVPQWVANSMVQQLSHSVPWNGGVSQAVIQATSPMANVIFPNSGNAISWPMTFQIIPFGTGIFTVQATATATVASGKVTGYTGLSGGSGYPPSTILAVQVISAVGSGALVFATTNSSGVVTSLTVQNGGTGYTSAPTLEIGVNSGYIEFYQPIVAAYCNQAQLNGVGACTNPTDLQVLVPYALGSLSVTAPTSGWAGTAYTVNGVQRTQYLDYPEWTDYGQAANYQLLANQKLLTVQNTVIEGSLNYFGKQASFFTLGNAVNIAGNGYTTGYEAIAAPARSVVLDYCPDGGGLEWITRINFSTRMRPFCGDRLYAHPNYLAVRSNLAGGASNIAAGFSGAVFQGTDFSGGIGGAMASAGDMGAMPIDSGVQMPAQRPRPVGIAEAERENQRNRAIEPPPISQQPFDEVNPSDADMAEARRRQRADRRREGDDES
jgi:hypothetical protein